MSEQHITEEMFEAELTLPTYPIPGIKANFHFEIKLIHQPRDTYHDEETGEVSEIPEGIFYLFTCVWKTQEGELLRTQWRTPRLGSGTPYEELGPGEAVDVRQDLLAALNQAQYVIEQTLEEEPA